MNEQEIKKVSLEYAMQLMREGRFGIINVRQLIDTAKELQYYFVSPNNLPTLVEEMQDDLPL